MIQATSTQNDQGWVDYSIETDPTKSFTDISHQDIANSLGLVSQIMFDVRASKLNMWDALDRGYQHRGGLLVGNATIGDDLSYNFPGDPPLKPLAKYTRGKEIAYQYQYGLMMVEKEGKLTATRMD
jgi:hypothetical protein